MIKFVGMGDKACKIVEKLKDKYDHSQIIALIENTELADKIDADVKLLINEYNLICYDDFSNGQKHMQRNKDNILELLKDSKLVVLVACFGTGCGSGGCFELAKSLNDKKIPFKVIGSKPFWFEGKKLAQNFSTVISELKEIAAPVKIIDPNSNKNIMEKTSRNMNKPLGIVFDFLDEEIVLTILKKKFIKV